MKYKDVYENCKRLALSCGEVRRKPGFSESAIYVDPFECDLCVYYNNALARGLGKMQEFMRVYLGGREVYAFDEERPDWECIVDGRWEKLIYEFWRYDLAINLEESYIINGVLLELCKMESRRNREILNRYREICALLAREGGKLRVYDSGKHEFTLERMIDGHIIEICLKERPPREKRDRWDDIELYFDKKIKFRFHWNCNIVGSLFDEKGKYIPGEWEKILERLAEEL